MIAVLLGSVLSLLFFSAALAAELQGGEPRRARELACLVGILMLVALYSGHTVMDGHWPQLAGVWAVATPG
jgi:hypothetical protein